ncbi:RICIN domain-containing protein [Streptomyces sp. NPDC002018]|uniref:RICIN domain-containing protein n=1 Tax=Streptomyces sp. NPDC002018 TaxID=3364629 RepID=UPI0036B953D8
MEPAPDPNAAHTAAEFTTAMRQLRRWADVSFRELERRAATVGDVLPRATVSGVLARHELPRAELLAAYVRACGLSPEAAEEWLSARRRLAVASEPPTAGESISSPQEETPSADKAPDDEAASAADPIPEQVPAQDTLRPQSPGPDSSLGNKPGGVAVGAEADRLPPPIAVPAAATASSRSRRRRAVTFLVAGLCALTVAALSTFWLWPKDDTDTGRTQNRAAGPSPTSVPSASGTSQPAADPAPSPTGISPSTTTPGPSTGLDGSGNAGGTGRADGGAGGGGGAGAIESAGAAPAPDPDPDPPTRKPPSSSTPNTPKSGWSSMRPVSASGLCLTEGRERNGRTTRDIAVQGACTSLPRVYVESLGSNVYRIQWHHPDPDKGIGCLAVDGPGEGYLLTPRTCADVAAQKYRLEPSQGGHRLRPLSGGLCVGFLAPRTEGAEAMQTACTGGADQAFRITSA